MRPLFPVHALEQWECVSCQDHLLYFKNNATALLTRLPCLLADIYRGVERLEPNERITLARILATANKKVRNVPFAACAANMLRQIQLQLCSYLQLAMRVTNAAKCANRSTRQPPCCPT